MNIWGAIQVDFERTPLGTRSRLADEIYGIPILRRTVDRILQSRLETLFVLCPTTQVDRCESLLRGSCAKVYATNHAQPPWSALVQPARKWSLDGWRGGIGGTTSFDEFVDAQMLALVLDEHKADAVFVFPPAAPALDPQFIDRMIEHQEETNEDSKLTFAPAPPGVTGIILTTGLIRELAGNGIPIGWVFSYKPDAPQKDLSLQPCCFELPASLRYAVGRLTADTLRSTERVTALLREHENPDVETTGRWLREREHLSHEPMPQEVEIELTTDDPYPDALLRPRGNRVSPRGPMDVEIVRTLVSQIAHYDDALVVLGGFGDPIRHPRFVEVLEALRSNAASSSPLYGLAVRTSAVDLTDEHIEAIIRFGVDILEVSLDAWTPQLYGELQCPNCPSKADLSGVLRSLDKVAVCRQQHHSVKPIIVPTMTKARLNVHELDEFYDGWIRKNGAVSIIGASHYAGQFDDHSAINMTPSPRVACRRLRSRAMVLADGSVTLCDQDVSGRHAVGRIGCESFGSLWTGSSLTALRDSHRLAQFDAHPLCATCSDWHRP